MNGTPTKERCRDRNGRRGRRGGRKAFGRLGHERAMSGGIGCTFFMSPGRRPFVERRAPHATRMRDAITSRSIVSAAHDDADAAALGPIQVHSPEPRRRSSSSVSPALAPRIDRERRRDAMRRVRLLMKLRWESGAARGNRAAGRVALPCCCPSAARPRYSA